MKTKPPYETIPQKRAHKARMRRASGDWMRRMQNAYPEGGLLTQQVRRNQMLTQRKVNP